MPIKAKNMMRVVRRRTAVYSRSLRPFILLRKYIGLIGLALTVLLIPAGAATIPTFDIVNVTRNGTVTIETSNFPPNQTFFTTIGYIGSRGIGGIPVGSFDSNAGGTFQVQFTIPMALYNQGKLAIRTQTSHANPYYSFNYFHNTDGNVPPGPGQGGIPVYSGIPTIDMTAVVRNVSVTFQTNNYPANQNFSVYMGPIGTRGLGGTLVGQFASGEGGSFDVTVPIPANLANSNQIAIRVQTNHPSPYYSYNWFNNTTTP
jgi:hypothetical protein